MNFTAPQLPPGQRPSGPAAAAGYFTFRPLFERHYLNEVPNEVFVNLSRLAAQWEDRINKAIEGMKKQALKYVQDEPATYESLLSRSHGQTEEIRQRIEELKEQLERAAI